MEEGIRIWVLCQEQPVDNLFDIFSNYCKVLFVERRGVSIISNYQLLVSKKIQKSILIVFAVFLLTTSPVVWGYPIEDFSGVGLEQANNLSQSINATMQKLFPINLFKFSVPDFSSGGQISNSGLNLINLDSFSKGDMVSMGKAVLALFLQIIITAVGVLLGILKVALELL